jgi:glycosyltransferase involved in cell wall biosynthesis
MVRFCFCGDVNDHEAYPRALASTPPAGWTYRPTTVEFDRDHGRPWARFKTRPGELIHASSLIPTNPTPWVLETDHIGFVIRQAQTSAEALGRLVDVHQIERQVAEAITGKLCLGALVWSKASRAALEKLCERHGVAPPRITQAYPAVVPPDMSFPPEAAEVSATMARLDKAGFKLLIVDGQSHRGASKVARRKNVSAAVECAGRLRRAGARVDLVVVGSTEAIDVDEDWLHVLPALGRGDLWHLYGSVDLLLFLSRQETFGYLPMEAMSSGLCCLAANAQSLPAIPEIIEHRRTGILVDFLEQRPYPELSDALDIDRAVAEIADLIAAPAARRRLIGNASMLFETGGLFSVETRNRILSEHLLGGS